MDAVLDQKIYGVILWDGACAVTVNILDNLNIGRTFVGFKVIDLRRTKLLTSRTVWTRALAGRNVMYRLGCYKTPRTIKRACGHRLLLWALITYTWTAQLMTRLLKQLLPCCPCCCPRCCPRCCLRCCLCCPSAAARVAPAAASDAPATSCCFPGCPCCCPFCPLLLSLLLPLLLPLLPPCCCPGCYPWFHCRAVGWFVSKGGAYSVYEIVPATLGEWRLNLISIYNEKYTEYLGDRFVCTLVTSKVILFVIGAGRSSGEI